MQHAVFATQWDSLGLGAGGQIRLIAPDPADASTVYLGSDVAGLWRSSNQGATWQYLTRGWSAKSCESLAFDQADNQKLFIAMSEGIFQSEDRGETWTKILSATNAGALAVVRDSGNRLVIYFGTGLASSNDGGDGQFYRYNYEGSGVLEHFTYAVTTGAQITTLVDPADSSQLWISTGTGVFRSSDGGATWTSVSTGLPEVTCGRLLADPSDFDHLLVAVRGLSGDGGIYRKISGMLSWTNISGNLTVAGIDWNTLATDPSVAFGQAIWAGSATLPYGVYYTSNGLSDSPTWSARQTINSAGWAAGNPILTNPHSLVRLADGSLWVGKNGNFHQSTDGGLTWQQRYTTKTATIAAITPGPNEGSRKGNNWINRGMCNTVDNIVAVDPAHPERILVALADRAVFASTDGGASFHQYTFKFDTLTGNSGFLVAFHPVTGVAYASLKDAFGSSEGQKTTGLFQGVFVDATNGWHWTLLSGGDNSLGDLPKDACLSGIAFSPDGSVLWGVARAFGSSSNSSRGVWESRDSGSTWQSIGLTNRLMQCLAAHPTNPDLLLIGVRAGKGGQGIWQGIRSGGAWTFTQKLSVTVEGESAPEDCVSLAFDPAQPGVTYAAMEKAGIYKSTDSGTTWAPMSNYGSTASGNGAQSVATTSASGVCFASSGGNFDLKASLKRSSDSGDTWLPMSPPFPESNFMLVSGVSTDRYLYIATSGMGSWRVPLSYAGWKRQVFSTEQQADPAVSGPLVDCDGDGKANLEEYASGSNPTSADNPSLTPFIQNGRLAVLFPTNPAAMDLQASVEGSRTLPFSNPTLSTTQTLFAVDEMLLWYVATDAADAPLSPRFLRLKLTLP